MPDIIVTTPRKECGNSKLEGAAGGPWFRTFPTKPDIKPGDLIWFVERGEITGRGEITILTTIDEPIRCATTGRLWGGDYVLEYDRWKWLERPITMRGFRGYRYVDRIKGFKAKLARAIKGRG